MLSQEDKKHLRAIRRERQLAGPVLRSNKIAPKKGKGSYKRTAKYRSY